MRIAIRLSQWMILTVVGLVGHPVRAQNSGAVTITSDPPGLAVYIDRTLIGVTPIKRYALPPGRYEVRIPNPNRTDWDMRDWVREIEVVAGQTSMAHARFVGVVVVNSTPFDADVYVDDIHMGVTPIRLRDLPPGVHTVVIRKDGYADAQHSVVVSDTSRQSLMVTLTPQTPAPPAPETMQAAGKSGRNTGKILGFATLGLGVVFSGLALHEDREADHAYGLYLRTGDPAALERFFQEAERHDKRRSAFVVAAQVNFLASLYFFVSPLFRSEKAP